MKMLRMAFNLYLCNSFEVQLTENPLLSTLVPYKEGLELLSNHKP